MKKIVVLATLGAQATGILSLQLAHTTASIADADIPDNDVASSVGEANDSSASVTIMITWRTICEGGNHEARWL